MPRRSADDRATPTGLTPTLVRLHPPDSLSDAERQVFVEVVVSNRPDHFRAADAYLLAAFARAVCLERHASERLEAEGHVIDNKANAWLHVLGQATKSLLSLSRLLRINPQSRGALTPKPGVEVSYYERQNLLEGRHGPADQN